MNDTFANGKPKSNAPNAVRKRKKLLEKKKQEADEKRRQAQAQTQLKSQALDAITQNSIGLQNELSKNSVGLQRSVTAIVVGNEQAHPDSLESVPGSVATPSPTFSEDERRKEETKLKSKALDVLSQNSIGLQNELSKVRADISKNSIGLQRSVTAIVLGNEQAHPDSLESVPGSVATPSPTFSEDERRKEETKLKSQAIDVISQNSIGLQNELSKVMADISKNSIGLQRSVTTIAVGQQSAHPASLMAASAASKEDDNANGANWRLHHRNPEAEHLEQLLSDRDAEIAGLKRRLARYQDAEYGRPEKRRRLGSY